MSAGAYIDALFVRSQIERLKLDFPELSEDAELLADMLEGSTELHEVLTRIVRAEREAKAYSEAVKAQEEALSERRARFVRRQQMSRSLILSLMETAGQTTIPLPEATLSITKGKFRPVVTDETLIPREYLKVKTSPDISAIGAALANGVHIPGAYQSNGASSLTIRVK